MLWNVHQIQSFASRGSCWITHTIPAAAPPAIIFQLWLNHSNCQRQHAANRRKGCGVRAENKTPQGWSARRTVWGVCLYCCLLIRRTPRVLVLWLSRTANSVKRGWEKKKKVSNEKEHQHPPGPPGRRRGLRLFAPRNRQHPSSPARARSSLSQIPDVTGFPCCPTSLPASVLLPTKWRMARTYLTQLPQAKC